MQTEPGITQQDTLLAITTFAFDLSVPDLYLPLIAGAQIKLIEREITSDASRLAAILSEPDITFVQATPATWQMLLAAGWQGNKRLKILCGGEALTRSLANQLLDRSASLWHMYGPTETTVWSMIYQVTHGNGPIPLGYPIANTQIYLLHEPARRKTDPLKPVSVGEIGEIYIGGDGVARGYLNRPEINCQRFINNPFSDPLESRLYKTGDLARLRPDGGIEIIGRIDHQVKIRGYRIELGDVEAAFSQHAAVREVVVIAREDIPGDRRLAAYVVLHPASEIRATELRAWLKDKLPDYMVPGSIVFMDALPLTPNRKIDRRALPIPTLEVSEDLIPPRTKLEEQLAQIWTSILGVEVGIYHNFFESGGNSLRTALLLNQISKILAVEMSLECLFKTPTIAGLAEVIEASQSSDAIIKFETTPAELQADAILDPTIFPLTVPTIERQHIFLTGATGFIGAFLLCELLLQEPMATIYCLVRAKHLEDASHRLQQSLENYGIWQESFGSRIIPVIGDLAQPLLGLSNQQFEELADRIDVIYHSGAYVNLVYPYTALSKVNVGGTREILRLATQGRTKPVHYISTLDVFQSSYYQEKISILESDELLTCEGYSEGYAQSKWVAEKLVMAARDRGLPVCIYRLGMIVGHTQTGGFQLDNLICRMIKGFIQLGYAPELDLQMSLAPVDYISQAITHLSRQPESYGKTFHLFNPHVLTISQLVANINALGYAVTCIPDQQWQAQLLTMPSDNALTPMVPMLTRRSSNPKQTVLEGATFVSQAFDDANTQVGLAGANIVCPPISSSVLKTYLAYFIRQDFLPRHPLATTAFQ
jgi:thioester reductase-like protein